KLVGDVEIATGVDRHTDGLAKAVLDRRATGQTREGETKHKQGPGKEVYEAAHFHYRLPFVSEEGAARDPGELLHVAVERPAAIDHQILVGVDGEERPEEVSCFVNAP